MRKKMNLKNFVLSSTSSSWLKSKQQSDVCDTVTVISRTLCPQNRGNATVNIQYKKNRIHVRK